MFEIRAKWYDFDNQDEVRPTSIMVETTDGIVELNEDNSWKVETREYNFITSLPLIEEYDVSLELDNHTLICHHSVISETEKSDAQLLYTALMTDSLIEEE